MSATTTVLPREYEAVPVTLARMEGTVNLVADRVEGLMDRMTSTETNVGTLQALTQRLDLDAISRDKTAVALALALKDAEVERRNKETQTWSPFAKAITALAALAALASIAIQLWA